MLGFAKKIMVKLVMASAIFTSASSQSLIINFSPTGNAAADSSFRNAANIWQSLLADNVSINIVTGFNALGSNTLGQTGAEYFDTSYASMKVALTADAKSSSDYLMVENLPNGSTYSKLINGTSESETFFDGKNYTQHGLDSVEMTRANAKSMGLIDAYNAATDATIMFNNEVNFDFDLSDGISSASLDFTGIALHEIGHALGFVSGVDVLDFFSFFEGTSYSDADYSPFASPLDFTRCSDESISQGADMDWTVGNTAKHFSIDGECSIATRVSNAWSTGVYQGDGFEASHWKNDLAGYLMEPSPVLGESLQMSQLDLLAYDVIGWDLVKQPIPVPEPSGFILLCMGILALEFARLNKKS